MPKGSFREDRDKLVSRFAHAGTPEPIKRRADTVRRKTAEPAVRSARINEALSAGADVRRGSPTSRGSPKSSSRC